MPGTNTARFINRSITLKSCFQKNKMIQTWKKYVRQGLRNQELLDLHDYFEFHCNCDQFAEIISNQVINGIYRPKSAQLVRIEKKYGICHHLQIPSQEDALVLQTIVETLAPSINSFQPTNRAYYSRSHGGPRSKEDIDESFPYHWS